MEVSLPSSLDFSKALPELPNGTTSTLMSVQSTNGITFSPGQVVQFDLPSRKGLFIDGKSVFIRYKITYTSGAIAGCIKRKPVYTTWARLDEFISSTPVNSIYQYNQVANTLVDLRYNAADVYGNQTAWGLGQSAAADPGTLQLNDVDGVVLANTGADNVFFVSAPLLGSFMQECDKLIPTGLMGPIRVQLTIDTIASMAVVAANVTNVVVSQPELCFSAIDFGSGVEDMIASMAPKLYLKTGGYSNASQTVPNGTSGFQTLPFNHRYESIRNLYLLSTPQTSTSTWGDSYNPMGGFGVNGTAQFSIGSSVYPQLPINNATGGVASVLEYCREAVGMISDNRLSQCFFRANFEKYANAIDAVSSANASVPAKFVLACPLSRINQTSPYQQIALMSGVSATSTPINVLLNMGSALATAFNFYLIAEYDQLIEIDVMTKQVRVIC